MMIMNTYKAYMHKKKMLTVRSNRSLMNIAYSKVAMVIRQNTTSLMNELGLTYMQPPLAILGYSPRIKLVYRSFYGLVIKAMALDMTQETNKPPPIEVAAAR